MGGENNVLKKLREKSKSKKGFTLVELIVVIVIILILAAVMVPSLLKYIDRAQEANCRADAATIMSQLQADYAASLASDQTNVTAPPTDINGVPVTQGADGAAAAANAALYTVNSTDDIIYFTYNNGDYIATWRMTAGTGTTAGWTTTKV